MMLKECSCYATTPPSSVSEEVKSGKAGQDWQGAVLTSIRASPDSVQELTLNHPNIVNQKKNMELLYGPKTFLGSHTQ